MNRIRSATRQQVWRVGKIDSTDYKTLAPQGKARVKLIDKQPGILTKGLPIVFPFTGVDKAYFMPKIGDRVIILADEKCEDGVIIGSIYFKQNLPIVDSPDVHSIDFDDGTKLEYDKDKHELTIDCQGKIKINSTGSLNIDCDDDITIKARNIFFNP